jgi:hypothetical protein
VTLRGQIIQDRLKSSKGVVIPVEIIDEIVAIYKSVVGKEEKYGPGFNRDETGYRMDGGELRRYSKQNPR